MAARVAVYRLGSGDGIAEMANAAPKETTVFDANPLNIDGASAKFPVFVYPTKINLTFLEDGGGDNDRGHFFWNSSKSTMDPCGPWRKDQSNIKTCASVPALKRANRRPLA